jgi:DNA-binding transcriptional LysR family regulator
MKLASLDLNLLVALDVLLEEQSVTRAAERLFIGQPAMSATLTRLRSVFDDPLLVRDGRGMRITPVAKSLRGPLASILSSIQHLVDSTSAFEPAESHRVFTITASDYVGLVLLRPLLEYLSTAAPHIQIRVLPVQPGLLDDVARGVSDLAIYPQNLLPDNHPFSTAELFDDEFVCVVDAGHPTVTEELTAEQFSSLPYLASHQGIMRSVVEAYLDDHGYARNTVMTTQSFVVAPFMLPGTPMFTLIQRRLTTILSGTNNFRVLSPPHPLPAVEEVMLWAPRNTNDPGLTWLRSVLRHLADQLEPIHRSQ